MTDYTSIQILPGTREQLASLKETPRETYDDVLNKLMELIPKADDEGEFSDEFRVSLLNAKIDTLKGRTYSLSEVRKSLGLKK